MTSKEALDRLKFIADNELNTGSKSYGDLQEFWNYKEPLKVIEDLVERDTPTKVIKEVDGYIGADGFYDVDVYKCGVCAYRLIKPQLIRVVNFCPKCGQRLDWSNE